MFWPQTHDILMQLTSLGPHIDDLHWEKNS